MTKISKKLISKYRKAELSKVIPFSEVQKANDILSEINLGVVKRVELGNYDPSHKAYLVVQNLLSYFSEEVSILDDFEEYYDSILEISEVYVPSYPPMSPLTTSYFSFWGFCDFRFGKDNETIVSIFYDLVVEYDFDTIVLKVLDNLKRSHMGFYKIKGFDNDLVILKDIISEKEYHCVCPVDYKGEKEEIWYVRIVQNLDEVYDYYIIITTPYVILNYLEKDWTDFFQRQIGDVENYKIKTYDFLKHHSDIKYWHNYLLDAYVNYNDNCIFLTGIPDIKGSKPCEMGE